MHNLSLHERLVLPELTVWVEKTEQEKTTNTTTNKTLSNRRHDRKGLGSKEYEARVVLSAHRGRQ